MEPPKSRLYMFMSLPSFSLSANLSAHHDSKYSKQHKHNMKINMQRLRGWLLAGALAGVTSTALRAQVNYQVIKSFSNPEGTGPKADIVFGPDGLIYGTARVAGPGAGRGVVYKFAPSTSSYQILHAFAASSTDGGDPECAITFPGDGFAYGTTLAVGAGAGGVIYRLHADGSGYTVMHSFGLIGSEGTEPRTLKVASDGLLYGVNLAGGNLLGGTLFRIDPVNGAFSVAHAFGGAGDGNSPRGPVLSAADGALYGTTEGGGAQGNGTIFRFDPATANYSILRSLAASSDGAGPRGGLAQGVNGLLYGANRLGGSANSGTLFQFDPTTGAYTVLHHFGVASGDGSQPVATPTLSPDGILYGTTSLGGTAGAGSVFRFDPATSAYEVLHSFGSFAGDGSVTHSGVVLGPDGAWYGATENGGASGKGTLYRLTLNQAPIARAHDVTVNAIAGSCSADVSPAEVNNGSSDPDAGDTITFSLSPAGPYPVGTTAVTLTVTDSHGATGSATANITVRDVEKPTLTVPANITTDMEPGQSFRHVTFAAVATDNCSTATVTYDIAPGSAFSKGTTTVTAYATDASQNQTSASFTVTVIDTEKPTITAPANLTVPADPGQCDAAVTFASTATDNSPGVTVAYSLPPGTHFPKGATTVTATATDTSGNQNAASFTVTVIDTQAPALVPPASMTVSTDPGACDAAVNFAATASDNCPGVIVAYSLPSGTHFPKGTTIVTVTATDTSGNQNASSFTVTVIDTQAPTLLLPANIIVSTEPGLCDAAVNFAATASDNCPGVTVAYSLPPGTRFSKGTTTVIVTATDASGNQTSGSFNITVVDTENPSLTVPANIVATADRATLTRLVTYSATASDNCPGVSLAFNPPSGSAFPLGTTVVTSTATDAAGNQTSGTFTVTIKSPTDLYPIAIASTAITVPVGGVQEVSFDWLTWAGSPSEPTLAASLTAPGNSSTYVNPANSADHLVSIGDWVQNKPGASNGSAVRNALESLKTIDIAVVLYDQSSGNGNNANSRVSAIATVRIIDAQNAHKGRLTIKYLGQ